MKTQISNLTRHFSGNNLKARSARGVMVLGCGTVAERGLRFIRNMILARLLLAQELGLMALIIAATIIFEAFTEVGIKQSVIQNKNGAQAEYLNAAWWLQSARALGIYILAFLMSPLVCRFYFQSRSEVLTLYDLAELVLFLRLVFLVILFNGFISPRAHVLEKHFKFGRALIITQGSGILSALVTIGLALFMRNVWALVIGFVIEGFCRLLFSYIFCPFRPRFKFHPESHRAILKFARGVFGLPILTFLAIQTDVIVLGKVVTTEQLGKYAMVYTLARLPMELFVQMFGRVMLSAYSEKQDSLEYLSDSVLRLVRAIAMLGVPLILFMALYAKPLLTLVFGASFAEVSVAFRLLAIVSLLRTQEVIATAMYLAIGQPHLHRRFIALRAVIIVVLIYPAAVAFGLVGSASVILLGNAIAMVMQVYWLHKRIGLSIKAYVYCWFEDIWLCLIVIIPLVLLQFMRFKNPVSYMVLGAVAYFVACCVGLFRIYRHILHKQ